MTPEDLQAMQDVRESPRLWFEGFGYYLDDENNRQPTRGPALVLQRRYFEHYRRCLAKGDPCRIVGLKYRRASSSTGGNAILYHHCQNFTSRCGVIGKDYKSSSNMLDMVKTFGQHDEFPGWYGSAFSEETETVEWEDRVEKEIATRIVWTNGSRVELYTAQNPTSARSAGLQCYLATEVGVWPKEGEKTGAKTLTAMRNTLPKHGFHVCIEESTAEGAEGIFFETCKTARWPDYADWWRKWESDWPLQDAATAAERRLQFVLIFAAWFEDERNFYRLDPTDEAHLKATLDKEEWYEGEQELIDRYLEDGPRGKRLGAETDATVWEQLAWRRVQIKATGGLENFKQEYPSNPLEAFRSTGAPVFCQEGLAALDVGARGVIPEFGLFDEQRGEGLVWRRTSEREGLFTFFEQPRDGCRYVEIIDPMTGQEIATSGRAERDRHAVIVMRDGYTDALGIYWYPAVVARVKAPNQWDIDPMCDLAAQLSTYFGRCPIVVESNNSGAAVIKRLRQLGCNLYQQSIPDKTRQTLETRLGWMNHESSRRDAIEAGKTAVREQVVDVPCPHMRAEMKTFIHDKKGKAVAASGHHDDDVLAFCIGMACLGAATVFRARDKVVKRGRRVSRRVVA